MPLRSTRDFSSSAAGASSWRSISRSIVDQRDLRPGLGEAVGGFQSQQAAADHHDALFRAAASQRSTSRESRKVLTPARSAPGTFSRSGVDPVASTSLENDDAFFTSRS